MQGVKVCYRSIGIIHTPFKTLEGMPIQPTGALGVRGWIEIFDEFVPGLKDLDGFSHVILIYHFHQAQATKLVVRLFMDDEPRGVSPQGLQAAPIP
jgi:tRNA (Thr-GGU) A37 N-methylase